MLLTALILQAEYAGPDKFDLETCGNNFFKLRNYGFDLANRGLAEFHSCWKLSPSGNGWREVQFSQVIPFVLDDVIVLKLSDATTPFDAETFD